jgi:16S rRNA processing protein RimM
LAEPSEAESQRTGYIQVGVVRGVHGQGGELRVEAQTGNPLRFTPGSIVHIQDSPYTVETTRRAPSGLLLKLEEVTSDADARLLTNAIIEVPETEIPPAPEDTYYHFQVLDMAVVDTGGTYLGRVIEVIETGANDVYVVVKEGVEELLVPAIASVVVSVDVETGQMTIDPPEGLEPRALTARTKPKRRRIPPRRKPRPPQF